MLLNGLTRNEIASLILGVLNARMSTSNTFLLLTFINVIKYFIVTFSNYLACNIKMFLALAVTPCNLHIVFNSYHGKLFASFYIKMLTDCLGLGKL